MSPPPSSPPPSSPPPSSPPRRSLPPAPLPWPSRASDAHKGNFGRVVLIGGSRGMAGSISLASIAALKTGSGLVSAAVPDRCLETVASFHPGIMTIPLADAAPGCFSEDAELPALDSFDAFGCGPGMRSEPGSAAIVEALLGESSLSRVMDADALNLLAEFDLLDSPALPDRQATLILTPHPGELARLVGVSPKDREGQLDAAAALVEKHGVTMVVKGGPTVVLGQPGDSDRVERYVNNTGNPGMATGGTGDVLTGVLTSLAGQGFSPWDAARLGVYLHGLAGDLAARRFSQAAMTCWELLECLPAAIAALETGAE